MDIYNPVYPGLYYFDTFTFTTLGTSGHRGPDSTKTYANAPWREGDFSIVNGQQQWTVPATGTYRIEAAGAYGATPGRVVSGEVDLNEGQVVSLLVGQQPNPLVSNVADNVTVGGGGGTFVTVEGKPLIVASGGDGGSYSPGGDWGLPVPITVGVVASFMNDSGTRMAVASQTAGTLMDFNGSTWVSNVSFPGEIIGYFSDSDIYTYYQTSSTNLRIKEYTFPNNLVKYTDIVLPVAVTAFLLDFSRDGQTFLACNDNLQQSTIYRRENGTWTYKTTVNGQTSTGLDFLGPMSADGNRIVTQIYNSPDTFMRVYDYPWTSYTDHIVYDLVNHGSISPDGSLYVTFGNVYSVNTGAVVTALPGDTLSYQGYTRISGDNKTIFKGISGAYLSIIDYSTSTPIVVKTYQATSFTDFYLSPLVNQNGSVFASTDILNKVDVYYKSFVSQSGIFLPSGTGLGISGSGYLTDGSVTNPYFGFLKPQAYVDGGFGNMYWYGHKGEGGFGGGQSPLNKTNQITSLTCNSPQTIVTSSNIGPLGLNKDGTVLYFGTILPRPGSGPEFVMYGNTYRYVYTSGSWNLDFSYSGGSFDFSYNTQKANLSVSDDGNTCVVSLAYAAENDPVNITIIQGTSTSQRTGTTGKVSKNGSTIVYTDTSNLYVNDQKITVLPPGTFISMFDLSSDGKVIAVSRGYQTKFFVTRYPWTTYETINTPFGSGASLLSLSPDGTTVFATDRDITQNGPIQVYKGSSNVASSDFTVRWVDTLTSCYDGTVFAGYIPKVIQSQNEDHRVYFCSYGSTALNQFQTKSSLNMFFAISSNGNKFVSSTPTEIHMYTKQGIATSTFDNHGFPHDYQVKFDLTSNYNGTHDITVTSPNTFTFQAFGETTETGNLGKVFGTSFGISGGGGYTGSPGDGVSGATCYADPVVRNFTDLGAASNSAGYVTVSLVDPVPITFETKALNPVIKKFYSNRDLGSIIWSAEFGKYFAVSYSAVSIVLYSADLESWTGTESPQGCQSICWSPKLKLFTIGKAVSSDGLTWTPGDSTKSFYEIVWCDFMNSFFAWNPNTIDHATYPFKSADGLNWTAMTDGPLVIPFFYNSYLPSESVGPQSLVFITNGIVYSFDGTTWLSHQSNGVRSVYYNNQFVLFLSDSTCYTSLDGTSWSYKSSFSFDPESIKACTIFENTLYVCSSNVDYMYTPHNRFYSSQDLLTWTRVDPIGTSITNLQASISSVVNVNSIILASTYYGKTLVSVDFRVWSPLKTSLFPGSEILWATLCFSPETGYLVATGNTDPERKTVIYYSNDAVIWNSVTLDTEIHDVNEASWMPAIGKFIFNGYYLVDPLNNWEVSTIPDRPNGGFAIYSQWYPIGKVLITTNGDQTNDAYNWRNDPNVTISSYSGTAGISGGWLYPSTMVVLDSNYYIRTSTDAGKTWITTNYPAPGATFGTSGTLCIAAYSSGILITRDGLTWTPGTSLGPCYGIFWISSIKMFAAVFQSEVSVTSDGINWSPIYLFSGESILRAATWCENINTLVIIPYSGDYTLNITF